MAGLTGEETTRDGERGQILLVATLVLAVSFVVLALVVNSAIFSGNLATRNDAPASHDAVEYRADIEEGVGEILRYFNRNLDTSHATLRQRVESRTATLSEQGGFGQAQRGRLVSVDYPGDAAHTTTGARIVQANASRNLTSVDNQSNWVLAEDIMNTRDVRFNFTHVDEGGLFDAPEQFQMRLSGSSGTWRLSVERQFVFGFVPLNSVDITVETPSGSSATCSRSVPIGSDATLSVDLVNSTANGEFCRAFSRLADGTPMWLGTGLNSSYDIEFQNSEFFNGTYEMVVDGPAKDRNFETDRNDNEPYTVHALYSVTVDYAYHTPSVGYEAELLVAPGAIPRFPSFGPGPATSPSFFDKGHTVVYAGLEALSGDNGTRMSLGPSNVNALGPLDTDFVGNSSNDLPYVGSNGNLKLLQVDGSTKTLVSDSAPSNPAKSKTLLATGRWNGTGPSVFYANENNAKLYRVDASGSTTLVADLTSGNGVQAVMGTGDIDADGTEELVFADGSQQVRYLEPDGTVEKVSGGQTGSNNGVGAGKPPDFDRDGTVRAILVDGSNNVKIAGAAESDKTFPSTDAKKGPLAGADIDSDGDTEIVYVSTNGFLRYIDNPLGSASVEVVRDASGNKVSADGEIGVIS